MLCIALHNSILQILFLQYSLTVHSAFVLKTWMIYYYLPKCEKYKRAQHKYYIQKKQFTQCCYVQFDKLTRLIYLHETHYRVYKQVTSTEDQILPEGGKRKLVSDRAIKTNSSLWCINSVCYRLKCRNCKWFKCLCVWESFAQRNRQRGTSCCGSRNLLSASQPRSSDFCAFYFRHAQNPDLYLFIYIRERSDICF